MNQHLQNILNTIQQDKNLSEEEKNAIIKSLKDADKEFEITNFELDRTEKVKRTTAILLEETIEELEHKRKAIEAQNRELEIETALERVRSVAMSMSKPDDLLSICETMFHELNKLGFVGLRNAMIDVHYDEKKYLLNYDYAENTGRTITTYVYNSHPEIDNLIEQARQSKGVFTEWVYSGKNLNEWRAFRKQHGEADDSRLDNVDALYYYFYSLGSGDIGISTFTAVTKEQLSMLKRFGNVFDLAYRRYIDISNAEAQAHEAKIEASLERMRAAAMSMQKSDEIIHVSESMYKELTALGFNNIRNAQIAIQNETKQAYTVFEYSDYAAGKGEAAYNSSHIVQELYNELGKTKDAFYQKEFSGKEFEAWRTWRKTLPVSSDSRIDTAESVCFYLYSFGTGHLGISTFNQITEEQIEILKRFKKVFELSYQRYTDVAKAEAQSKEAKIELALERVRARTMAMQKSDELGETAFVLFQQFEELGEDPEQIGIGIMNEEEDVLELWSTINGKMRDRVVKVPLDEPILISKLYKAWKEDKKSLIVDISGKDLEDYNNFRNSLAEIKIDISRTNSRRVVSAACFSKGHISLATTEPRPAETLQLLERFANVFDLTYTRFLDLKQAEAQARESQIEAALERVRSGTMAMQHSNELAETSLVLFKQIKELGFETWSCGFCTWQQNDMVELWMGADSGGLLPPMIIPYKKEPTHKNIHEASLTGVNAHEKVWEGQALEEHYSFLKTIPSVKDAIDILEASGLSLPERQCYYVGFFDQGYLLLITKDPNDELKNLSKRFAKVFNQTYTRFLDLQKSEAQSRESQIQLALERARTQSIIMQHSNELNDTLRVFHEQVLLLNIPSAFSFLWLPDEENDKHIFWAAWAEADSSTQSVDPKSIVFKSKAINYPLDRNEPATAQCLVDWKGTEPIVSYHVPPSGVTNYFAAWQELINGVEQLKPEHFSDGLYYVEAFMKYGCFGVIVSNDLTVDEKNILGRFAIEFERTYRRFLDLQKAEAQAREAQIEMALEKVRSRTMAMQRSDELPGTAALLFQEFKKLEQQELIQTTIGIYNEEKNAIEFRATSWEGGGEQVIRPSYGSMDEPTLLKPAVTGWKAKAKSIVVDLTGEQLEEWVNYRNKMTDVIISSNDAGGRRVVSIAFFSKGHLSLSSPLPLPAETLKTLERFAAVFDGTYTRFLDLQKAEAQARESKIEASLERVRSKAMSMQKSEDLAAAISIVFEELDKLDLGILRCGIGVLNKEKRTADVWTTTIADNNTIIQVAGDESMDIHPLLSGAFDAWLNQRDHNYTLKGEDLTNYYKAVAKENIKLPASQSLVSGSHETEQYYYNAVFSAGGLFAFRDNPFPLEAKTIIRRFADVFTLTYTRFSDLKQAEAQAKEAKIEVALERVRSRTLAMQKSDELAETAAVLFKQLILLGIQPNRLYIAIVKDDNGTTEFWITDEDGSKVSSAFETNLNDNPTFQKMFDGWKQEKKSLVIDMQGEELQDYFNYLTSIHVPFKGGLTQKRRLQDIAYFSKGFIGMASPDELPSETLQLLERFAAVFNLTYTRFNDLQVSEAHAIQAELDLIAIKEAKQKAEAALTELQYAQKQLIQSEKMASLGELTAGIAHEIQNPLNFVNNFSEVSVELIQEMVDEVEKGNKEEAKAIADDLIQNLEKINHHGKRADAIVKGMLQHSRSTSSTKEPTDINKLADEYLRLAYHGLRAKDKSFNATIKTDFDESIGKINIVPQDIGRMILNLITNAFYAVAEKKKQTSNNYEPTVTMKTSQTPPPAGGGHGVWVTVTDNGDGIPQNIADKIFQPFFTTKPTGQGTGLGLSLAYDIVKAHGGELKVETKENEGTNFIILLAST